MNARTTEQTADRLQRLYDLQRRIADEIVLLEAGYIGTGTRKPRRSRYDVPACGSETAYQRHKHRGETCTECKAAHAAHERVAAAARRVARAQRKARMAGAA